MPKLQPITRERHAGKCWQRYTHYGFAAGEALAPLVAHELPKALLTLPLAFARADAGFMPVAVLGLQPGQNLFVDGNGRWLDAYIPAIYRGFPFRLARTSDGQQILVVDEESGLVSDGTVGEPFFNPDGTPSQAVGEVLAFLTRVEADREVTGRLCAVLQARDLIQPWIVRLETAEGEQAVEGLFCIDEARFNTLPDDDFLALRTAGALPLAYCQMLSMQHLPSLGSRIGRRAAAARAVLPMTAKGELDLEFLNRDGTLSFTNL